VKSGIALHVEGFYSLHKMIPIFQSLRFDFGSFLLGCLSACLVGIIVWGFRKILPAMKSAPKTQQIKVAPRQAEAFGKAYLHELYLSTQRLHLAGNLFPLDEVMVEPLLLAPPVRSQPGDSQVSTSIIPHYLPYMPDWPELSSLVHGPKLRLAQAISGGMDISIIGPAGSGKTSLFIHLISCFTLHPEKVESISNLVPFYLSVRDLDLQSKGTPEEKMYKVISAGLFALNPSLLKAYFHDALVSGRALILLDGLDELSASEYEKYIPFVEDFKRTNPKARMVITSSREILLNQAPYEFTPLILAHWTQSDSAYFITNWFTKWAGVNPDPANNPMNETGLSVIENALSTVQHRTTPFELTLQLMLACSGMPAPERPCDLLDKYLSTFKIDKPITAATARIGFSFLYNGFSQISSKELPQIVREAFTVTAAPDEASSDNPPEDAASPEKAVQVLTSSGFLKQTPSGEVYFSHPLWLSYFAFLSMAGDHTANSDLLKLTRWQPGLDAIHFLAMTTDITVFADQYLSADDQPLFAQTLTGARWLPWSIETSAWRVTLFKKLALNISRSYYPFSTRLRFISALALSGDSTIPGLFNHYLSSGDDSLRQLAILGFALTGLPQNIAGMRNYLSDKNPQTRFAACLAMGTYSHQKIAIEHIARALLNGDEPTRRVAAEILATDHGDGYTILREAVTLEDILTRRAVVNGLAQIQEPWAMDILRKMQVEDSQWVVRNAAAQTLEVLEKGSPDVPRRISDPHNAPWLIEFASKQGYGISPEKDVTEILHLALNTGTDDEKNAAIDYLHYTPSDDYIASLYHLVYAPSGQLRETAIIALWNAAFSGYPLPPVQKFGLGYPAA
jgi:HEAT repeat protein